MILLLLALLGHAFLWVTLVNRLHGTCIEGRPRDVATLVAFAALVFLPLLFAWLLLHRGGMPGLPWLAKGYLGLCWLGAAVALGGWSWRYLLHRRPAGLRYQRTSVPEPSAQTADEHHLLVRLPGNEILQLNVVHRGVALPRLPSTLDRLSIVHLSDFHFTGRIGKSYFLEAVRLTNELQPDLICITGDLIDDPAYIDWVPETFGQLVSRHGVYFVLGNHDLHVGPRRLRQVLTELGLVDLGGRWHELVLRGQRILLAGNERPWFRDDQLDPAPRVEGKPFRIALAHSPDQLSWARSQEIDLLLAGHTHGGQIRFPLIGPIFSPCRQGVKYAWGLYETPPTILHVTCGLSGEFPVRMNCPPELVHLVLRAPTI